VNLGATCDQKTFTFYHQVCHVLSECSDDQFFTSRKILTRDYQAMPQAQLFFSSFRKLR